MEEDENIYYYALKEVEEETIDKALWAKAYALSNGDSKTIKPKYIQLRVTALKKVLDTYSIEYIKIFDINLKDLLIEEEWVTILCDFLSHGFRDGQVKSQYCNEDNKKEELLGLTSLSRPNWRLDSIPNEIGYLTSLTSLDLYCEHYTLNINELPKEIGNLHNLRYLNLHSVRFPELPKEIGKLINLEHLILSFSDIPYLPKEIGTLINLKTLSLRCNTRITTLPMELFNLNKLEKLNLEWLALTELPKEIGNLSNLKMLSLIGLKINKLPKEIMKLQNLEAIYLYGIDDLTLTDEQKNWLEPILKNDAQSFT